MRTMYMTVVALQLALYIVPILARPASDSALPFACYLWKSKQVLVFSYNTGTLKYASTPEGEWSCGVTIAGVIVSCLLDDSVAAATSCTPTHKLINDYKDKYQIAATCVESGKTCPE